MDNILFIITTTGKCNLKCDYCGGSFDEFYVPYTIKYNVEKLVEIIRKYEKKTIVFYGGEPLLNHKFIKEFLSYDIGVSRIGIQTNGTLVKLFDEKFWDKFDFVLLSIDGEKEITDKHRGKGVYDKVISSAKYLKSMNIETIARMAITMDNDIYKNVTHLINTNLFDKIHWQLDVIWDNEWDVISWAENSYLPGIEKLINLFIDNLRENKILKIIPIIGILNSYYFRGYDHIPCGAGKRSFTINSDGRILACPIGISEDWNILGNVENGFKYYSERLECEKCEYFKYCGGRCLYSYKERFWGEDGFKKICYLTKKTIDIILSKKDVIKDLLNKNSLGIDVLRYDPTEDSTEVIP